MFKSFGPSCTATALLLTLAIAASGPSAFAQQSASASDSDNIALEEVVVTARKTEERLKDVPLSISAFTEAQIEASGIKNVSDIAQQTPGFSFRQGFGRTGGGEGGAGSRPSIRGMSNILGAPNASFFVDGIYVSGNITSYQLDNLERVEVIRGPQSALFGRQTFSGAINFVTRKPDNEFRGRITGTLGQYDHREVSAYVTGPLIEDKLFGEINFRKYSFGGDYVNADSGARDINGQKTANIGGKLRYTPTENLEIIASASYSEDEDKGYATYSLDSTNLNCQLPTIIGTLAPFPGAAPVPRSSTRARGWYCGELKLPFGAQLAYNNDALEALGYHGLERSAGRSDITINYDWNDWVFTSVTAANKNRNTNGFDNNLVPSRVRPVSLSIGNSTRTDISQELRVTSPRDRRFRTLFGGYYFGRDDGEGYNVRTSDGARLRFRTNDGVRNSALFAMLEFDVLPQFTLTAEGRYQKDEITETDEAAPTNPAVINGFTNERKREFKKFLPRLTAKYKLNDDWNVYSSWAKGNKPGGFNGLPSNIVAADLALFRTLDLDPFEEENVEAIELGLKGGFAENRYSLNAAIFYNDWLNQQLTRSEPYQQASNLAFTSFPFIVNAGESEIKGIELELAGRPARWFDFRLAYAFVDAKFLDFYDENTEELFDSDGQFSFNGRAPNRVVNPLDTDGPEGQVAGNRLPQTPQHQASLSLNFTRELPSGRSLFLRNDLAYESKRYVQVENLAYVGASTNWNMRMGVQSDKWTVTAYGNNLREEDAFVVGTRLADFNRTLLTPDPLRRIAGQPLRLTFYRSFTVALPRKREFGLTATYKF